MIQKKKNLLKKIVKKDYNNELEKILEQKQFGEHEKSTLLNILYKIEASYKDVETVKQDVEAKEEYIYNLLEIIKEYCDSIKIINMSDEKNKIPDNRTYIINKEKKEIIAYPIERKILYAIAKIEKKEKIIKEDYYIIDKTLSELINVGNNINMVEPLRDFNGYSWTTVLQEIESIDHNLIYQNLRILVGYKFLNSWVKNNEYIIDFYENFKEKITEKYGKENKNRFIDMLAKISILLSAKFDNEQSIKLLEIKEETEKKYNDIQDKEKFINNITKEKLELSKKIKELDKIINNETLLKKEYIKRNESLELENKIFSIRVLAKIMETERKKYIEELEELNSLLTPLNFIKYKKKVENQYNYLKVLDTDNIEKELEKYKLRIQELFLKLIEIDIKKAETKQEVQKQMYNLRYYLFLPYDSQNTIKDVQKLQNQINNVITLLIDKAIELKAMQRISKDKETNYEILKKLFNVRIIKLDDAYLKITKEKDKYFIKIFDENVFEEKIEISKPKELEVKLNKNIVF